ESILSSTETVGAAPGSSYHIQLAASWKGRLNCHKGNTGFPVLQRATAQHNLGSLIIFNPFEANMFWTRVFAVIFLGLMALSAQTAAPAQSSRPHTGKKAAQKT